MAILPEGLAGSYSGMVNNIAYAGVVSVLVIVFIVAAYFVLKMNQYNINVTIYSKRAGANNYKVFKDRAAFVKNKEGGMDFKLKRFRKILAPPSNDYMLINDKGKNEVILYQANENQFHFVKPIYFDKTNSVIKFRASDEDVRFWAAMDMQRSRNTYGKETMLEKLLPIGVIAVTAVFCLLLLYFTIGGVKDMVGPLTQLAKSLSEVAANLKGLHVSQPTPAY